MDGIDVALIRTDGQMQVERGPAMSFAYTPEQRVMIEQAISDAKLCKRATDRPGRLADTETELTQINGAAVSAFLRHQGIERESIDVVGFHGQTVAHRPDERLTIQLGDGPFLAELVRRPVVYDLRQDDVLAGGQGAPLAPVYHQAMVDGIAERPVAVLNIGGVANVTWIGNGGDLLAFDTGPGNALLDDWMAVHRGARFDADGALAASGTVNVSALNTLAANAYFDLSPPKSLDRNHFSLNAVDGLDAADGAATLLAFTSECVANARRYFPAPVKQWIITGGGRHNSTLMRCLSEKLEVPVIASEDIDVDGDSVEAQAWAYLAVRACLGLSITFPGTTGVAQPQTGGKVVPWLGS